MRHLSLGYVLAALVVAALPSVATADTRLVLESGATPQPYQQWVDVAKVPTPELTVRLDLYECGPSAACTYYDPPTIVLGRYGRTKLTFFHELGHQYLRANIRPWAWSKFLSIWGPAMKAREPHEVFADWYGICAIGDRFFARYYNRDRATRIRYRRTCRLITDAALG